MTVEYINKTLYNFPEVWVLASVQACEEVEGSISKHIAVTVLSDEKMLSLNRMYRKKSYVPDVLSFPLSAKGDTMKILGEIYLSGTKIQEQAQEYNHSLCEEFLILCIHGIFHVLGYDHITDKDFEVMKEKEKQALIFAKKRVKI